MNISSQSMLPSNVQFYAGQDLQENSEIVNIGE